MNKKTLNVGLIGKTNAGKSTLINALVGEKISIENKKINTTLIAIEGIKNIDNTQITFYDSPGLIFSKQANVSLSFVPSLIAFLQQIKASGYFFCLYNVTALLFHA